MARRKRTAKRTRSTRTPISDEELIAKLQDKAPKVLDAAIPDALFDTALARLLEESPSSHDVPHFYCRPCGEYHLKTHPHYQAQKQRVAQRKAEKATAE